MRFLLDTHALLWFLAGDAALSSRARQLIENEENEIEVSAASLWEIAIKISLGKLRLSAPFAEIFPAQLEANAFEVLPIRVAHLEAVCILPFHHRDPFDRLLIAQAQTENLPIISVDAAFDTYAVRREW